MKKKLISLFFVGLVMIAGNVFALDASGQRYTKMLATGGPGTIGSAAQDIYNTGVTDQEVLDVAAQVLSDFYQRNPNERDFADATSWLCKALGASNNGRYRALLKTVSEAKIHKRTHKYCDNALDSLPKNATDSFVPGSVDVSKYKEGGAAYAATKPTASTPAASPAKRSGGNHVVDFSVVKEGMSMEEVDDLLGPPTNQTTHMTGKQFQPFNYGARDLQRTIYLYKGVGRIEFSLKSAYQGVYRVIKIIPNPDESGYP